jgi:hypothetical protein
VSFFTGIWLGSGFSYVGCLRAFGALNDLKLDGVAFLQGLVSIPIDRGVVDKNIGAIVSANKSIAFRIIEPFDRSLHADASLDETHMFLSESTSEADPSIPRINWPECIRMKHRVKRACAG